MPHNTDRESCTLRLFFFLDRNHLDRSRGDLNVLLDMKTIRIPCCCRQRRRVCDSLLTYGNTAVDLFSAAGSIGDIRFAILVTLFTKENG